MRMVFFMGETVSHVLDLKFKDAGNGSIRDAGTSSAAVNSVHVDAQGN
jgi:hypothetical protein